jgi:acetate kinase
MLRYQVKNWIGAFAAALGGLDTPVFAGGVGENVPTVRARICDGLGFLGIELETRGIRARCPRRPSGPRFASSARTKS